MPKHNGPTSYAQWYVQATAQVASDAFKAFRETGCAPHYLYFKPHGLMFAIVQEDMPKPEGFELVTGERIPSDRSQSDSVAAIHENGYSRHRCSNAKPSASQAVRTRRRHQRRRINASARRI